jgi:hypothetical protein
LIVVVCAVGCIARECRHSWRYGNDAMSVVCGAEGREVAHLFSVGSSATIALETHSQERMFSN